MAIDIVARALAIKAQQGGSGNYDDLQNTPICNVDLLSSSFIPVSNTYYRHIGDAGYITIEEGGRSLQIHVLPNTIYRYIDGIYVEIGAKNPIPIYVQGFYNGELEEEDWGEPRNGFYYYTIKSETHKLSTPYVDSVTIPTDDGWVNATYTYTRLLNNDIRLKSDRPAKCKFTIVGNK